MIRDLRSEAFAARRLIADNRRLNLELWCQLRAGEWYT